MSSRIWMRIRKAWHCINLILCMEGYKRAKYIKKHSLFGAVGSDVYFHPWKLPGDPEKIYIGNNVKVASEVLFINHDILNAVLNCKNGTDEYEYFTGTIHIEDNVMIGSRSIILPNVNIGSNVVVAAGSVVCKDIPSGCVVGGSPAVVIGKFTDLEKKRKIH